MTMIVYADMPDALSGMMKGQRCGVSFYLQDRVGHADQAVRLANG
jgi:hypothetical protein